jgi:hypothetical protein
MAECGFRGETRRGVDRRGRTGRYCRPAGLAGGRAGGCGAVGWEHEGGGWGLEELGTYSTVRVRGRRTVGHGGW